MRGFGSRRRSSIVSSILALLLLAALAVIGLLLTGVLGGTDEGLTPLQVFEQSSPGVVEVRAAFGGGRAAEGGEGLGSGFVVSKEGYVLTNAHVVMAEGADATAIAVIFREKTLADPAALRVEAKLVGRDEGTDVALLKIDPAQAPPLHPLPLAKDGSARVGEPVVAIGSPLGLSFSASSGIVSATDRNLQAPDGSVIPNGIQTDAAINSGNSGGPLINSAGEVIGINTQIITVSGGSQGLGFAVSIATAVRVMEEILTTGSATHSFLGVNGHGLNAQLAQALGAGADRGLLVVSVTPGSPAETAGIRSGTERVVIQGIPFVVGGDIITAVEGEIIADAQQLASAIAKRRPGDTITISLTRGQEKLEVKAVLAIRPQ